MRRTRKTWTSVTGNMDRRRADADDVIEARDQSGDTGKIFLDVQVEPLIDRRAVETFDRIYSALGGVHLKRNELGSVPERAEEHHRVQSAAMARKVRDLQKVAKREQASLKRDDLREQRIQVRGRDNAMASLEQIAGLDTAPQRHELEDLQTIFMRARDAPARALHDRCAPHARTGDQPPAARLSRPS
jgi:hypothetical protein